MEWKGVFVGLVTSTSILILTKILDIFADKNKKKIDIQKAFLEIGMNLYNLQIPLMSQIKIAQDYTDPNMNDWCHEQVEVVMDKYRKELVVLTAVFKSMSEDLKAWVTNIRNQMKKYQ